MSIQVKITRNSQVTNQASFPSMEEAQAWVDSHVGMGSFGSPRWSTVSVEIAPAVVDEAGLELSPAQREDQQVENVGGYEIAIIDVSAVEAQKAINEQSLKHLAETDWVVIRFSETAQPIPEEILASRAAARAAIVR
jgi:hypothetical protein